MDIMAARLPALARAGNGALRVWLLHALPTCVGPIVTVIAAQLGALLGGAIVLERLLERQGLGTVVAEALSARDLPVIAAYVLLAGVFFVIVNLITDISYVMLDPRIRLGAAGGR